MAQSLGNARQLSTAHFKGAFLALALTLWASSGLAAEPVWAAQQYAQTSTTTDIGTGQFQFTTKIPQFTNTFTLWGVDLYIAVSANATNAKATIKCWTASNYTSACSSGEFPTAGIVSDAVTITTASGAAVRRFEFASTTGYTLSNTRYYTLTFAGNNSNNVGTYGTASPAQCTAGCSGDPYMIVYDSNPGSMVDNNNDTHVISVSPADGATTTTSATITTSWWVNEDDAPTYWKAVWGSYTLTYQENPFDPVVTLITNESLEADQTDISTTTTLAYGVYTLRSRLQYKYLNGTISGSIIDQEYAVFTVGTSSLESQAFTNLVGDTYDYIRNADATTTAAFAATCAPFTETYDTISCIAFMFLPNPQRIGAAVEFIGNDIAYRPPFAYITLGWAAMSGVSSTTAATSSLPALAFTIPSTLPGAGASVNLTPWDKLLGTGSILSTAEAAGDNPETIREIVEPGWNSFVYLLFGLIVITQLLGMTNTFTQSEIRTTNMETAYSRRRR